MLLPLLVVFAQLRKLAGKEGEMMIEIIPLTTTAPMASSSTSAATATADAAGGGYSMATAVSFVPTFALSSQPCQLCMMVDRSGSMQAGASLPQSTAVVEALLNELPTYGNVVKKFNVMKFGSSQSFAFEKAFTEVGAAAMKQVS